MIDSSLKAVTNKHGEQFTESWWSCLSWELPNQGTEIDITWLLIFVSRIYNLF